MPPARKSSSATKSAVSSKAECVRRVANFAKLAKWTKFDDASFDATRLRRELPVLSPKLQALVGKIRELDAADAAAPDGRVHKHFVFSGVTGGFGAKAAVSALLAHGFELVYDERLRRLTPTAPGNGVALLASSTVFGKEFPVRKRRAILADFNARPDNVYGDSVRIVVADGGFKEGVDLFDVRYVHVLEPQDSPADSRQVIGRATRNCGQQGLAFLPHVGWPLKVFVYDALMQDGRTTLSSEALRAAGIDTSRFTFAERLEHMCKIVAVDATLTRAIHGNLLLDGKDVHAALNNMEVDITPELQRMLDAGFDTTCSMASLPLTVYAMLFVWMSAPGNRVPTRMLNPEANKRAAMCALARSDPEYAERLREAIRAGERAYVLRHVGTVLHNLEADPNYQLLDPSFKNRVHAMVQKSVSDDLLLDAFLGKGARKRRGNGNPDLPQRFVDVRDQVQRLYAKRYTWPGVRLENGCAAATTAASAAAVRGNKAAAAIKGGGLVLNPTQGFMSHYFRPQSDVKGMLLWHSVGTGKTCSAVATASRNFEAHGYTVLWVTRTTLKKDLLKNLEGSQSCHASSKTANWLPALSYRQFTNLLLKKNRLYGDLVKRNGSDDPLRKTLVVIDEAHKLFGGTDLKTVERPDVGKLRQALMQSYERSGSDSCRLLLMTATPWVHDPMEMVKLLNLLREADSQLPEAYSQFKAGYLDDASGEFTAEGRRRLLSELAGYISHLDRSKDARQFAQPQVQQVLVSMSDSGAGRGPELAAQAEELKARYARELDECKLRGQGKRGTVKACKELLAGLEQEAKDLAKAAKEAARDAKSSVDQVSALKRCVR